MIEGKIDKKWADCDVDKIRAAGESWKATTDSIGRLVTVITDHRTVLSPEVQKLEADGDITVVRMELDDNLSGQTPTPSVPGTGWTPPVTRDPNATVQVGVPSP